MLSKTRPHCGRRTTLASTRMVAVQLPAISGRLSIDHHKVWKMAFSWLFKWLIDISDWPVAKKLNLLTCDSAFTTRCSFNVYHGHSALQNSSGLLKTTIHKNTFFVHLKCMQYLLKTFPALLVANVLIKLASFEFKCYGGYIKVMCLGSRRLHGSDWSKKKRRSGRWYVF